jgi:hypothetical protein
MTRYSHLVGLLGDQVAGISAQEQQNQTVAATVTMLQRIGDNNP